MNASLAITPEVGQLLYALTLAARPTVIIEFGASLGSSTIYLASALRDLGAGSIITTELLSEKAQQASSNLAAAGLGDLVIADMSHGDPHHNRYRDYVTDPARPYVTTEIRLDAGLVISTRAPTRAM